MFRIARRIGFLSCLLLGTVVLAQADSAKAREELEKQLKDMVGQPPTRVKVTFQGLDEPGYSVVEAVITLDGAPLPTPAGATLSKEGEHLVFHGDYKPGDHRLEARVTIADAGGVMFSYQNGFKWKVGLTRTFTLEPGLEVHVVLKAWRDSGARDTKEKFKFTSTATPKMLAVLDDGSMPEPLAKRPRPVEVDAGTGLTAAEKAAEAKRLAAEEKKRKADEALAAKLAAEDEKRRQAEEAKAAKLAAADERKRKQAEDQAARLAAAEEKKRLAGGLVGAAAGGSNTGPLVGSGVIDSGVPEVDAGVAEEGVDAGPPVVEVAKVVPKPAPVEPVPESGMPWIPIGLGVALAVVVLLLLARRRANPRA